MQIGTSSRKTAAAVNVSIKGIEALLSVAVHISCKRMPSLLDGFEESVEQWADSRPSFQLQGSVAASPFVLTGQTCLHSLEVGQAVRPVPGPAAWSSRPAVVVHWIAPLEDHSVN